MASPAHDTAAITQRRTRAVALRAAGATYDEIGDALGITKQGAANLVLRAVRETQTAAVEDMRAVEGQRLDMLQRATWAQALRGDQKAVQNVLRIMERRARLFGLDAPVKIDVGTDAEAQIGALAAALAEDGVFTVTDVPPPEAQAS